jgi:predicted DNA-binding transcriptional regulator
MDEQVKEVKFETKKEESSYVERLGLLGFSKAESLIYVYLLDRGMAIGVSKIAAGTKMHRQQVYMTLPSLLDQGVIESIEEGKVSKYKARPPRVLENVARRKMLLVDDIVNDLTKISKLDYEQEFEVVIGNKACQAFEISRLGAMKENEEQFVIGHDSDEYYDVMGDTYKKILAPMLEKKKIVTYYLAPESQANRSSVVDPRQTFKLRVMKKLKSGPLAVIVQGDLLVFFINVNPVTMYVIKSKKVAEGYKEFFMMLWNMA